jgi:methyltransferase (TIGR00027 family)
MATDDVMAAESRLAIEDLSAVSNTAFLTLWARAIEARSADPILDDPQAVALIEELRPHLAKINTPFHRQLVADKVPKLLVTLMALRARYFDQMARSFLLRFPRGIVVNLGCGLDTRFERLNASSEAKSVRVIDVDLPSVITLKEQLLAPHPRHPLLASSVLEHRWMDALDRYDDRRFIFLAEGLLMYLPPDEVKRLLVTLARRFAGSELVADLFNGIWLRPPWRELAANKMERRLNIGRDAAFQFGLDSPNAMEAWHPQIRFSGLWSFFDAHERKLGWMRVFRHVPLVRLIQYVVHYQLG